jgi:hypothetical protein
MMDIPDGQYLIFPLTGIRPAANGRENPMVRKGGMLLTGKE